MARQEDRRMTSLPPIDLTAVNHHSQPPPRPKARDDFGTHVPQQRQANTDERKPAQTQTARSALEATPASASASLTASNDAPRAATGAVAESVLPEQEGTLHEALAPVKASLAMPGLSGRIYPESLRVIGYLSMLDAASGAAVKASD